MSQSVSADAVKFFHESISAQDRGDFNGSYQLLLAAINEDKNLPGAWNNLGVRLHEQRRWASAAAAFYRAHTFAPEAIMPLGNYAWNLHLSGRDSEAIKIMDDILGKEPGSAQHWVNASQIHLSMGNLEKALELAHQAVFLDPESPMPRMSLGLAQLRLGNYAEGLRNYEARFPYIPVLKDFLNYPYPMWRGEDISEKRLFIAAEQGLGDSVMFLRFIPEAVKRAKKTIVIVHDNCLKLFRRNLSGLGNVEIYPLPHELPAADVFSPLLSLPIGLGYTNEQITSSYMKVKTPDSPLKLDKDGMKKVGICWAGDSNHDNDKCRSARLEDFLPLAEAKGIQLYSLQVGPKVQELDLIGSHGVVKNMAPYFKTVSDTAGFIKNELDYVVTVDTSVAHIAGSVGVETYMLTSPSAVDWRWQTGEGKTPWYPSMTLVKQKTPGDWKYPIETAKKLIAG